MTFAPSRTSMTSLQRIYEWPIDHEKMLNVTINQRNANETTMRYHFTPVKIAIIITTSIGKNIKKNGDW